MNYLFLGEGFEELEAVAAADILRRGGVELLTAGIGGRLIAGAHGIVVQADIEIENIPQGQAELIILPGGMGGVESIMASAKAISLITDTYKRDGKLAAICAAPMIYGRMGILDGKKAVIYPGMEKEISKAQVQTGEKTVQDGKILTGQAPGAAIDFGLVLLKWLKGEDAAESVRLQLHYNGK